MFFLTHPLISRLHGLENLASLDDNNIVDIFLHGDDTLDFEINKQLFTMAQSFLVDSKRFNTGLLQ